MPHPDKPDYTHGSTGTQPPSARDYTNGDAVDPDEFDYFIDTSFDYIKELIDAIAALDSNDDGQVDAAEVADDATNATSSYKGNDIDSDGDASVDASDDAEGIDGVYRTAGSLPHYGNDGTGQTVTNEGTIFYDEDRNDISVNRG